MIRKELIDLYVDGKYKTIVLNTVDSTNRYARDLILKDNGTENTVVIANEQTKGRGRLGKTFESKKNSGIYMSIIKKYNRDFSEDNFVTVNTAVAVVKAILDVTGINALIKWVNDIYVDNKKVSGILVEGVNNLKTGKIEKVIIGIGINVNNNDFSINLRDKAGSLKMDDEQIHKLASEIINFSDNIVGGNYIKEYKEKSFLKNKKIQYAINSELYEGTVLDINEKGNLIVETNDDKEVTLSSGEVSIKLFE